GPGHDLQRDRAPAVDAAEHGGLGRARFRQGGGEATLLRLDLLADEPDELWPARRGRRPVRRGNPACPRSPDPHGLPLAMDLVVRAAVVYVVVLIYTRILGRRELSQLQPFDLIMLVVV